MWYTLAILILEEQIMTCKTVLITGSSRGIGRAIALRFAKEQYNIVINCLKNIDQLLQLKEEIESYGSRCLAIPCDVGDYAATCSLFEQIKQTFGSVDILINNAGISHIGLFTDMTIEEWDQIIKTNLTSVFNCSKLAAQSMISHQKGTIITISSVWGICGASCEVAYSTSKGGVNAFTKALAKELAPSNISVNAIACGAIDTEMNQFLSTEERQAIIDEIPANRFATVEETAEFTYQLTHSPSYLTGQIITFDGAWI